jgi:hypothetical protein
MQRNPDMALQRPLTRKEFIIQSLLTWREPWATLVDAEEEEPTVPLRRPDSEAPRPAIDSFVFDLTVVPA